MILKQNIPFEINLNTRPLTLNKLSKEKLDAEILEGLEDVENGNVYSSKEVYDEIRKFYDK